MEDYLIRNAIINDIPFLAEAVIAAEKGRSDKLSYATLFNLTEAEVKELLIKIFEEEIEGCELSLTSFLVAEFEGSPVAAVSTWLECYNGTLPSALLKANLILNTFEKKNIEFFKSKSHIIKDILAEREPMTLQLEYMFVSNAHLGKALDAVLIKKSEERAIEIWPEVPKIQGQLFKNSIFAVMVLRKLGFDISKSYKAVHSEVLDFLPFNEKLLMEKRIRVSYSTPEV